jgi:alkanesulfonate monooxygenase SsuD/methylene tetrahydromethanopterin reductase-like flavin-dependent oxidoreductase (luciferase family)
VKFGLFYLGQLPKPLDNDDWDEGQQVKRFHEILDQVELADRLGFDYVWIGEHHFLGEYTQVSAPEVIMGAISQRTKQIRIGSGITQMVTRHNHPARVAERAATIDVLSRGRYELGTGAGNPNEHPPILHGLNGETDKLLAHGHEMWRECTRECLRMLSEDPYPGFEGEYLQMPAVTVVPRPAQRPHPPIWRSTTRVELCHELGSIGVGCLILALFGPDLVHACVEQYWEGVHAGMTPIGKAVNPAVGAFSTTLVAPSDAEAEARAEEGVDFFSYSIFRSGQLVGHQGNHLTRELAAVKRDLAPGAPVPGFPNNPEANLIGGPETVRAKLRLIEDTNVDFAGFAMQNGDTRHEHIMESIELLATEVFPEFRDRDEQHQKWRAEQLRGIDLPVNASV